MLNRAFNDTSPGNLIYANQVTAATANLNGFANDFAASFASLSNADLANRVLGNLGLLPNDALKTALTDYYAANGAANRGLVTLQLASLLTSLEGNATYGAAAAAWNDEVATGFTYSANTANTGSQTGTPSQTFTLTTGTDTRTGGSADDTFDGGLSTASLQTLNSGDKLDGGAGSDTLIAVVNSSVTPSSLANIENIFLTAVTNATTVDLTNGAAVTSVVNQGSTSALTVSGIGKAVTVSVRDTSTNGQVVTYNNVTGSADAATVAVQNANTTLSVLGIESLTINSAGTTTNVISDLIATQATSLKVTGTAGLTLGAYFSPS